MMQTTSQAQPKAQPGANVITPISATPVATLTAEERKARYAELRARIGKPRLEVRGKPGKHYFWAHRPDTYELDRLDLLGYIIVREPNVAEVLAGKAKPAISAGGLREDGTYIQGDTILMECDQDTYDFLMMENEERAAGQFHAAKDNFLIETEKAGVPTFEVDKSKVGGR
jgi:hypothetical protein